MIRLRPLLLGTLALAALLAAIAYALRREPGLSGEQVYARVSDTVVMIYAADAERRIVGRGSGVIVGREIAVSCCHVIARAQTMRVRHRDADREGRLIAYDTARDLCLLHVPRLEGAAAAFGSRHSVRVGQRVYALGAPEGYDLTFSAGIVSALRAAEHGEYIQTTAAISDGSSGGGLFDADGRLVGITAFMYSAGQNLNFAAPVNWVTDLAGSLTAEPHRLPTVALPAEFARYWKHPLLQ